MKKISLGILVVATITVLVAGVALALPDNRGIEKAKEVSQAITDEGIQAPPEFVADLPESELTTIVFIRYAPGFQKDKPCDNDGVCDPDEKGWCGDCKKGKEEPPITACYGFLAGSKPLWNWIEDYYYSNVSLAASAVAAVTTWESATPGDIFGNGVSGNYEWGVYDYTNSISYGDYPEEGVIAVTKIWFRGKNIYEYDIMFDTEYFPGDGLVDLDTVTLHEFGHAAGLDDLYDAACSGEVMYWLYQGPKTVLGEGDTVGVQILYGI